MLIKNEIKGTETSLSVSCKLGEIPSLILSQFLFEPLPRFLCLPARRVESALRLMFFSLKHFSSEGMPRLHSNHSNTNLHSSEEEATSVTDHDY